MNTAAEFSFPALERPLPPPTVRELTDEFANARAEAAQIREDARAAGWAEGHAAATVEVRAALEPATRALSDALREAVAQSARMAETLEREAVELALLLAEKVVAEAVRSEPARVLDVIRGALRGVVERERLTILVHPDDLELVRDSIDAVAAEIGGIEHCDVQAERRVGRGGAVLRTVEGEVDVRLEAKLERAGELLREARA